MEIKWDQTLHARRAQNNCTILFLWMICIHCSFANLAQAKTSKISLSASNENVNESLEMASRTIANTYQRQSFYARYDAMGINRKWDLGVGTTYTRTDYSKFYIRDSGTNIVPLTTNSSALSELGIDASMLYQDGSLGYIFATSQPVNKVYFKQSSYQAGLTKSYYRKSTIFSFLLSQIQFTRPVTYYRDPETFVVKAQATKIKTDSVQLDWEQILSENSKTKNGLSYSKENAERPSNYSAFTKWAFSLTPTLFYKINYNYTKELTSDKLKNDRGYFTNHLFNTELSYEFIYDWVLSASYTLAREDEFDSRTLAKRRTGVDQYGLSLDYSFSKAIASLSLGHMESNTKIKSTQVTLGVSWNF